MKCTNLTHFKKPIEHNEFRTLHIFCKAITIIEVGDSQKIQIKL